MDMFEQKFEEQKGQCMFSSEYDRWSQKTYFENYGEMPEGDINEVGIDVIDIDSPRGLDLVNELMPDNLTFPVPIKQTC